MNDKIYDAAPGASAELATLATAWYLEDTADLGLGTAGRPPEGDRDVPEIVSFIEQLVDAGFAYAVDGDVYFRVARFPEYGRLSGQRPDQVRGAGAQPPQGGPARLRALEGNKPGEDTAWPSPWGEGRPGWHIECSVDGGGAARAGRSRFTAAGSTSSSPTTRTSSPSRARSATRSREIWAHNGPSRARRGEKMSKSVGKHRHDPRGARPLGARDDRSSSSSAATGASRSTSRDETMAQAAAQADGLREVFRGPSRAAPAGAWERFAAALDDDFNTPAALAVLHEWRDHDLLGRGARAVRARARSPSARSAPPEIVELAERRQRGACCSATSSSPTALRAELEGPAGRCGTSRTATRSSGGGEHRPRLRAPGRARGATRPAGGARAARDRACGRGRAVACGGAAEGMRSERELSELAGTRDHQGVVARVEPYRYADAYELAAGRAPAARRPRPRHRPAQPRRGLSQRRGGRRDRRRRARSRLGRRDPGGRARRRRARSSTCRSRWSRTSPATSRR